VTDLQSLTCTATGRCVAVGVDAAGHRSPLVSVNAGSRWRHDTSPVEPTAQLDCHDDTCLFFRGTAVYADRS
jgi:hypothetical protein